MTRQKTHILSAWLSALLACLLLAGCGESTDANNSPVGKSQAKNPQTPGGDEDPAKPEAEETPFIAYYFHRTVRCQTCLSIERQAQEAIELLFDKELKTKLLSWKPLNYEESTNEALAAQLEIETPTLCLVAMKDGEILRSSTLEEVWDYVHDTFAFQGYLESELRSFMSE